MIWRWRQDSRREWRDLADSWDDPAPERDEDPWEDDWDEDDDEWEDEDWHEDDWHEDDAAPQGWRDPEPRRRRSVLGWLLLLPFRLLLMPFRLAFWFAVLCLLWIGAYTLINPPSWTYLERERSRLGEITRFWQDLDQISPHLVRAVMAAEDARFCEHSGIDYAATRAAIEETLEGDRVLGGSTITQQTAKNVFLWHGRSWLRKGLEAGFALAMEPVWGKRRIMEVYLNVAEFDEGIFGAEAAARRYFGVPAARLTLEQAARLAAVLPDPKDRSATDPGPFTARRAAGVADGARLIERTGRDACVLG